MIEGSRYPHGLWKTSSAVGDDHLLGETPTLSRWRFQLKPFLVTINDVSVMFLPTKRYIPYLPPWVVFLVACSKILPFWGVRLIIKWSSNRLFLWWMYLGASAINHPSNFIGFSTRNHPFWDIPTTLDIPILKAEKLLCFPSPGRGWRRQGQKGARGAGSSQAGMILLGRCIYIFFYIYTYIYIYIIYRYI